MANTYYLSPDGDNNNSGTSERQPWCSLDTISRLIDPADTVILMPGVWNDPLPMVDGVTVQAKEPGATILDGRDPTKRVWTKDSQGIWSTADPGGVMGIWLGTFEQNGAFCAAYDGAYAKFDTTRPGGAVIPGSKSQWQAANGKIFLTTVAGGNPNDEGVVLTRSSLGVDATGKSNIHLDGITTRYYRRAFEAIGGKNIVVTNCDFGYSSTTAIGLGPVEGLEFIGTKICGGGSLLGHYEDVIHIESGISGRFSHCDISWGGHGLMFLEKGGAFRIEDCYLHDSGGSGVTLVRNTNNAIISGCWIERCATQRSPSVRDVGSAFQIHGNGHRISNCVVQKNSKHFLFSATGPGTDNPTTNDIIVDHCTALDAEENGAEMQEASPAGEIARNQFNACVIKNAGGDLLSLWFAGVGKPTAGSSNRFNGCQITGGDIRSSGGSYDTVEAAKARQPAVYPGCQSDPIAGAGSSLTKPPDTGGVIPPDPTPTKPVLTSLTPSQGKAETMVTARGERFTDGPLVLVNTTGGAQRLPNQRIFPVSDTELRFTVPPGQISGPVYVRTNVDRSNGLNFTIMQPVPVPLTAIVTASPSNEGASFSGVVKDGKPLPKDTKITVLVQLPDGRQTTATTIL